MIPTETLEAGQVALVGAGPGDPGLITLRGAGLLQQADVVVYDYLSTPKLLIHAPAAEHLYVGKKAASHSMTQAEINQLLIDQAKLGRRVVRLKGGDPFVFGRGGEEAEALKAAGVSFTIVPGITAAIAAPAYAGIPVTHRDFNSSFTLITGHEKEEAYKDAEAKNRDAAAGSSDLDWAAIAKLPCTAFYMGVKALPRITARLIEHGLPPETPAATIQWGTTPRQRTCVATVGTLADAVVRDGIGSPAITIIGRVVSMRETINWFETRPLFGQTIIVTRTRDQASELTRLLEAQGANVLEAPTIEIVPADPQPVEAALRSLRTASDAMPANTFELPQALPSAKPTWVVLTSVNGVRELRRLMNTFQLDGRVFAHCRIAVIGSATARAVRELLFLEPDCVPERSVAEALADELESRGVVDGYRFVLLRAEIARPVLVERLRAAGGIVEDVPLYHTLPATALPLAVTRAIDAGEVDWITFTSSSTARFFVDLLGADFAARLAKVKRVSIGPVTSQTLRDLGLPPTVEADAADLAAVADAIVRAGKASKNS